MATSIKTKIIKISDFEGSTEEMINDFENQIKHYVENQYDNGYNLINVANYSGLRSGGVGTLLIFSKVE